MQFPALLMKTPEAPGDAKKRKREKEKNGKVLKEKTK